MVAMVLSFMSPQRLWWLLLVPAIAIVYAGLSLRLRNPTGARRLTRLLPVESAWKRHFSVVASLLSLAALVLAYAQPAAMVNVPKDRATIVIAIDVSISMSATDVAPTRIDAEKAAASSFVDLLPATFNLAVVSFAATANIVMAPSTDRGAAKRAIDSLQLQPSTAIGEGIYTSLRALELAPPDPQHPDDPAPGAIVLLSDGSTNTGKPSAGAAELAGQRGVPIYTIAYGTDNGYIIENGQRQRVPVNHAELSNIAKASGGKKFAASSVSDLSAVYQTIAQDVGYVEELSEITERLAGVALLFALIAGLGVVSLAARWP
ncbi:MAG: VWA domain-containing protein [Propionibacteriaceae bacterium]|nr:VWA domain-containing protein [Propionibacteriaceae bacterium]